MRDDTLHAQDGKAPRRSCAIARTPARRSSGNITSPFDQPFEVGVGDQMRGVRPDRWPAPASRFRNCPARDVAVFEQQRVSCARIDSDPRKSWIHQARQLPTFGALQSQLLEGESAGLRFVPARCAGHGRNATARRLCAESLRHRPQSSRSPTPPSNAAKATSSGLRSLRTGRPDLCDLRGDTSARLDLQQTVVVVSNLRTG